MFISWWLLCYAALQVVWCTTPPTGTTVANSNPDEFYQAARMGDIDIIVTMLSNGAISTVHRRDSKGNSAFIVAAGRGQTNALKILLSHGALLEDSTKGGLLAGKTALCWAASQGREQAVSYLIEAGANPNRPTEDGVFLGKTPLMWASSQGKTGVVSILINSGAEIDFSSQGGNFKGKTSLMWASSQGRVGVVLKLLEAGANVDLVDNDGVSALMWATGSEGENEEAHSKGLFEKAAKGHNDVVKALLLYGASIDKVDKDGITALMYACFHGHADAVRTLINAGADTSLRNSAGRTALYLAQSNNHVDVVNVLIKGPNIMELSYIEMKQTSICGWILSILRRTEGIQYAHIRKSKFTVSHSCTTLTRNGLDGNIEYLLSLLEYTTMDALIDHVGVTLFGAKVLFKKELTFMQTLMTNSSCDASF